MGVIFFEFYKNVIYCFYHDTYVSVRPRGLVGNVLTLGTFYSLTSLYNKMGKVLKKSCISSMCGRKITFLLFNL